MVSNGSCFMVTWIIFKNHLLKVALTQNRETMALWMLTTIGLFYFTICEDPREYEFIEIAFGWGPGHIWLHTTLEDPFPHYMILEACWDGLWALSFGLSQLHGHGSWLMYTCSHLLCYCREAWTVRHDPYPSLKDLQGALIYKHKKE